MKDNLIKTIQKFLNIPFRYSDLCVFMDKQKDFLLQDKVLDKIEDCEYNALWDTIDYLEDYYEEFMYPQWIISSEISVLHLFNEHYKLRKKYLLYKESIKNE